MKEPAARSLVLDSQALSLLLRNDRQMVTVRADTRTGTPTRRAASIPVGRTASPQCSC